MTDTLERIAEIQRLQADIERLRAALMAIADASERWSGNVGSYAGGETWYGFAARLQRMAREAAERREEKRKCD